MTSLPPGFVPILGALLFPFLRGNVRKAYAVLLPLLSLAYLLYCKNTLGPGAHDVVSFLGYRLALVRFDALGLVFAYVFHLALFLGAIFSLHLDDSPQQAAAFVYAGATISGALAGDLLTFFFCFEVVAVASVFLIWARRTKRAYKAGQRYLYWQVASGLLLLAGILFRVHEGSGLAFGHIGLNGSVSSWLIFLAFGIKCGFPGLHVWLTDAYPEATPTGTVFLSAFTTKLAVYALARGFAGTGCLIWIGTVMTLFPIFYAVIENDLRRVLSYSMINQIGFMVVGVGIGGALGVDGAAAHAFADVIFKGLLFMSMGVVLQQTGKVYASDLGGLWKSMPFTCGCCIVGAASISAFPFFSAFATKSLIMEAVAKHHMEWIWILLLLAAAGVVEHAGIKIPFFAFFSKDRGLRPKKPPLNMRVAMGGAALVCIAVGVFPSLLYRFLPYPVDFQPYTPFHCISQTQLLLFAALGVFTLMVTGLYPHERHAVNLDADWFLRKPVRIVAGALYAGGARLAAAFQTAVLEGLPAAAVSFTRRYGPERGKFKKMWALGNSLVVVLLILVVYLVVETEVGR